MNTISHPSISQENPTTIYWWSETASPVLPFAADELRAYFYQMSGINLPVQQLNAPVSACPQGVLLVYRGYAFPALNSPPLGIEDSLYMQAEPGYTLLTGANARGTLYAVYAFLEKHGVRFYAPNYVFYRDMAEIIPQRNSLRLTPLTETQAPSFKYRRKYVEEGWSHTPDTLTALIDWMAKNRLNTLAVPIDYQGLGTVTWDAWRTDLIPELEKRGMILEAGGHGYQTFLPEERYQPAHPDWFGRDDEPVISKSNKPLANVFRLTNAEAMLTFLDNVVKYLRTHPEIQIFDAWPPDGTKWLKSDIDQLGSVSNAQAYVTRKLEERLQQEGLKVKLETIAYGLASDPPNADHMYSSDTIIDIAPYDRSYRELINDPGNEKTLITIN